MIKNNIKKLHTNNFYNLEEMNLFLEICNFPRLNKEETKNLKRPNANKKIEALIKNS